MKLKKLMALAMAGVLAVSMLAGCNGNTNNNNDPVDPDAPATGISADVGSRVEDLALKDDAVDEADLDHLTFTDDGDVTAALNDAVGGAGVQDILNGYVYGDVIGELPNTHAVRARVAELLEPTENMWFTNIGTVADADGDTVSALRVYAVSDVIDENTVKQQIARTLTGEVINNSNRVNVVDYDHHNEVWNYEYTISVAMSTKTVNSASVGGVIWGEEVLEAGLTGAENPTVTFVAVQIVRTATHQ